MVVGSFCISRTEVTVAEYLACASAKRCPPASTKVFYVDDAKYHGLEPRHDVFCNAGRPGRGTHPVNCIDARAAEEYCAWKGGRLPTEEEWEYAARGGDGRLYPWGNESTSVQEVVHTCGVECQEHVKKLGSEHYPSDNGLPDTAPVGSYPANASPFGALDMLGSLEEWTTGDPCAYRNEPRWEIGSPCYPNDRVVRGGRAAAVTRLRRNWQSRRPTLGFRCVHPGKG